MASMAFSLRRFASFSILFAAVLSSTLLSAPLEKDGLRLVVSLGEDSQGRERYVVADSKDLGARRIWDQIQNDPGVQRGIDAYREVQDSEYRELERELSADGSLDEADRQILADLPAPEPVTLEVRSGTRGAFNDWSDTFLVTHPDGRQEKLVKPNTFVLVGENSRESVIQSPVVVFHANDPVVTEQSPGLLAQTVVHEIAHGIHSHLVGQGETPHTDWLSEPHSGSMTTDGTLALIEGYAEFMGAHLTGRTTIAEDPTGAITQNLYSLDSSGNPKSASELWKTEGWAATVMYQIANSNQIDGGLDKIHSVLASENPESFQELVQGIQARYPETQAAVASILHESSHGKIAAPGGGGSIRYEPDSDRGRNWGALVSSVVGGLVGAVFAVPFGPVGILVAGAVGAGLGHWIGKLIFTSGDDDRVYAPMDSQAVGSLSAEAGVAPGLQAAQEGLESLRRAFEDSYQAFQEALVEDNGSLEWQAVLEEKRLAFEAASQAYQSVVGHASHNHDH